MLNIFGVPIADVNLNEAISTIKKLAQTNPKNLIVTANPEILLMAYKNDKYKSILLKANLVLADGFGVILGSYILSQPIRSGRVTGVDLVKGLIKDSVNSGLTIYLVGSTNDILLKTTQQMNAQFPNNKIIGFSAGPILSTNLTFPIASALNSQLIQDIEQLKPDILLVAYGSPKQELWLDYYLPFLPIKVGIGVGGTFEYLSQKIKRAPYFIRKIGLEWLFRVIRQPWRFGRILNALVVFPFVLLKYGFFKKNVPRGTN